MIIIVPLAPVLITILVFIISAFYQISVWIDAISIIIWIILLLSYIIGILYNVFRKTTIDCKIVGIIASIICATISGFQTKNFFDILAHSLAVDGVIWFGVTLIWGGIIWLTSAFMCGYANYICLDEDDPKYLNAFGYLLGSIVLSNFFGLL